MFNSSLPFDMTELNNPDQSSTPESPLENSPITMKIDDILPQTSALKEEIINNGISIKENQLITDTVDEESQSTSLNGSQISDFLQIPEKVKETNQLLNSENERKFFTIYIFLNIFVISLGF